MKCRIIILSLVTLIFISSIVTAQDKFGTVIIDGGYGVSSSASRIGIMMSDGGYLVSSSNYVIQSESIILHGYSVLHKYDVNGNQLWNKKISDFAIEDMIELKDGGIVVCGKKHYWGNDPPLDIYIVKLDFCGDVEWAKVDVESSHPERPLLTLRTVIDTGDGLLFPIRFGGSIFIEGVGYEYIDNVDMLKLSYDGDIIYRNSIPQYGANQEIWGGVKDDRGNIWMNGCCMSKHPYNPTYGVFSTLIMVCDSDGNLLYAKNAKDKGIDVYGDLESYNKLLQDDDGQFFTVPPTSLVITGEGDNYYSTSSMIKVDTDYNLSTHIINNPDVNSEPKSTKQMSGLAFINNKEHIVTSMRYVRNDIEIKTSIVSNDCDIVHLREIEQSDIRYLGPNEIIEVDESKGSSNFLTRLYVLDKNGKVVDSLDMDDKVLDYNSKEVIEHIFSVENNSFIVISVATKDNSKLYSLRMRKFTSDLQPALIDTTEREYDIYCPRPITSGLLTPKYEQLYNGIGVEDLRSIVKPIRLSPNPASEKVRVYLSNGFGEKRIEVYDTNSRLVKTFMIGEGWAQSDIDISDLPKGVYIVKLTVNGKLIGTDKLIKN